jgi:WD repeat-containing protein 19
MEAARIYQFVEMYEKAATIYIQLKHFKAAEQLIDKIKSPKLLSLLAKMKESEKLYKDAEKAYEAGGDWDNVIRINLKFLDNPEKAKAVIHSKSRSEMGALMLADYYEDKGKKKEAIEFLLIAKKFENAFIIAQSHNEMDAYAKFFLLSEKNLDEFKRIAQYYEGKNEPGKAGIFYEKCGNFQKALALFIKGGEDYIDRAVEMVGGLKNDSLTAELTEFLLTSSMLSVPKSLFKLYILLGKFKQASEISITLSVQEMELGKYKNARDILFAAYKVNNLN